jgi:hypothetical protein
MKKILFLVLIMSALIANFLVGQNIGFKMALSSDEKNDFLLKKVNALASFRSNVNISSYVRSGEYRKARCEADLLASRYFDEVKACFDVENCRVSISKELEELAPKFIAEKDANFKYYKIGEMCSHY